MHLWLPHPSAALWEAVSSLTGGRPRRRDDPTAAAVAHPLLSSLGRDAREMQLVLAASGAPFTDTHHPPADPPETLLGRLQRDLRNDSAPAGAPLSSSAAADQRALLVEGDTSLQVHACHGRARQVEVLREVLLGLLAADPTLEPRDVLVMCPDIEAYAPLISATFGLGDADDTSPAMHPGHRLRVRLADRSLRQTNPMLATMARVLELADGRITASQVLDLAALPPVRRRFRFDDDDLERLREWVSASGARWGLDAAHRAPFHLERVGQNTWEAGLDRVLLGAAMAEDDDPRWLGLALPLDDVDSGDIDLAGRLAELVDRLAVVVDAMSADQPLDELAGSAVGRARQPRRRRRPRRLAAQPGAPPAHRGGRRRGRPVGRDPVSRRRPGAAGRSAAGAPDPGRVPHRQPDDVLDGADALGSAPGDLPARPRRRRVPARDRGRRRRRAGPRPARR